MSDLRARLRRRPPGLRDAARGPRIVAAVLVAGTLYALWVIFTDPRRFAQWVLEDHAVEWATAGVLVVAALRAGAVARAFGREPAGRVAARVWLVITLALAFAALEEVSYGQRIFGIPTPDFLRPDGSQGHDALYNRQGEITLHNLSVLGVDVNKVVFSTLLGIGLALYAIVVPLGYRLSARWRARLDRWGVPVGRAYQCVLLLAPAVLWEPLRGFAGRSGEMAELSSCVAALLVLIDPVNAHALPRRPDGQPTTKLTRRPFT